MRLSLAGAGKGYDCDGRRLTEKTDAEELTRIRSLVIPPAWADVWICADERGHLQAVGTDARGRRQYRYHDRWRQRRDREKFEHMLAFARALPRIRRACAKDLARPELDRRRVLACAVRLLDLGFFRIGTEGYAEENDSYGLATMRKSHVRIDGDVVTFDYRAKYGKRRIQSVVDPAVHAVVSELKRRRGGSPERPILPVLILLAAAGSAFAYRPLRSRLRRRQGHQVPDDDLTVRPIWWSLHSAG